MDVQLLTQVSKRREAVDCFNCSALHRQCDRTRHRCETCSRCSEACGGYPREWQWLAGVKSRGKHKGRSMSIAASSREWQSTTPINHMFVFKQGNPQRKSARPRPKPANNSKTASSEPSGPVTSSNQQHSSPHGLAQGEEPSPTSVADTSQNLPLTLGDLCDPASCDPATLGHIDPMFDFSLMHDFDADGGNMLMPPLPNESVWPDQTPWQFSTIDRPPTPRLSLSWPLPALETAELLTLCTSNHPLRAPPSLLTWPPLRRCRALCSPTDL